jgi:hypothetical protein
LRSLGEHPALSARRFIAFCVLAAWIAATPVMIKTALDWLSEATITQVAFQLPNSGSGLDDRVVTAFRMQQIKQIQFLWEAAIWGALTVIGSALLAEPRMRSTSRHPVETELHVGENLTEYSGAHK